MKVFVKLTQLNLGTNEKTVLAEGYGLYVNDQVTYFEKENPKIKHRVSFQDDEIMLERFGEVKSELHFAHKEAKKSYVISEYGTMELDTRCEYIQKNKQGYTIQYGIYEKNQPIIRQRLHFEMRLIS